MANIRLIKRRIRSAKNIAQITKAMELVAASKMRKAQAAALSGRLYADKIYEVVMRLTPRVDLTTHPLLTRPKEASKRHLVIVLSTNKGLCGGLNASLFRFLLREYSTSMRQQGFITIGRKGSEFLTRIGSSIAADFSETTPFTRVVPALTELITKEFVSGAYEAIDLCYNRFVSVLTQEPVKKTILPIRLALPIQPSENKQPADIVIEPNAKDVLNSLLPHYLENQIRDAILQSEASEHSARMIAMRNATDNANSLMEELTLLYNKARQEKITYEISDLVTARLAVEV